MIGDKPRTLVVGATGTVWGRVTERNGVDLTAEVIQTRTVDPAGAVSSWGTPYSTDLSQAATGVVRAAVQHVAAVAGWWELQVKVGTEIVKCGPFLVVDA
jgi:hypothetical protein